MKETIEKHGKSRGINKSIKSKQKVNQNKSKPIQNHYIRGVKLKEQHVEAELTGARTHAHKMVPNMLEERCGSLAIDCLLEHENLLAVANLDHTPSMSM